MEVGLAGAAAVVVLLFAVAAAVAVVAFVILFVRERGRRKTAEEGLQRFSTIVSVEAERDRVLREVESASLQRIARQGEIHAAENKVLELQTVLGDLKVEIGSLEETREMQSFGYYKPRYGFEHIEAFAVELERVRTLQKEAIKNDKAAYCPGGWSVDGSAKKGDQMVKEQKKLMLRAFIGEADAAVAKVRYDNATAMQKRIQTAFETINKLGASKKVCITEGFLDLKLQELALVHEQQEKKQEQREEERRIREEQREAEKAEREIAQAQAQAEKDAEREEAALAKAQAELAAAGEAQVGRLHGIVDKLEARLAEALDRKARAMARAQFTRSGHVYVISNIGTYGPDVFKIGMTRRLDPYERIRELGDSSVPYFYDVHAIIYAENAPGLENAIHRELADRRINLVNMRREFFRVTLDDVRAVVAKHHGLVTFVLDPEAEEYRKSEALRAAIQEGSAALPTLN